MVANTNELLPSPLHIVALVPIKHHSERVRNKNFRLFNDRPLFHWIISSLLAVKEINEVVVDTDSDLIIDGLHLHFPSVRIIRRPMHLCGDMVPMNDILLHDVNEVPADVYLQSHATNPLLLPETISSAIDVFKSSYPEYDSLFSVKSWHTRFYDYEGRALNHDPKVLLRTQDLPPVYEENSCIYIFRAQSLCERRNRIGYSPQMFPMSDIESTDIDTELDIMVAEGIAHNMLQYKPKSNTSKSITSKIAAKLDIVKGVTAIRPGAGTSPTHQTVLVSAPHIMPHFEDRFRSLLESFGLQIVIAPVTERLSEDDLLSYAGSYAGTICGDDYYTEKVFNANNGTLKVVSKWGTGIDSIDQNAAKTHGVMIGNTPNAFSNPVADSVMAYILHFSRRQVWMDRHMKEGLWEKIAGRALNECTIGVLGVGNTGKAVIRRAFGFEATIIAYDVIEPDPLFLKRYDVKMVSRDEIFKKADFLTINCLLEASSQYIVNKQSLSLMKPTAIIINTARGPCICEADLVEALREKRIAGAGLDVFEHEPLPSDSPLRSMDNVSLAPHNSNSSPLAHEHVHWNTLRNLMKGLNIPYEDYVA